MISRINKIQIILTFCLLVVLSCDKLKNDDDPQPQSFLSSFESLTAEKDSIAKGESTIITARVNGNNVRFTWTSSEGPVIGTGNKVMYLASPCCTCNAVITCEARGSNGSESKSIIITVLQ
jgi:hypothetical protein